MPEPALAAGDAEYARAMATVLDVERQATVQAMVDRMVANVRTRITAVGAARTAYAGAATTAPLRAMASTRVADLWDALGSDLVTIRSPLPADVEAAVEEDSAAVLDDVHRYVDASVRRAFAPYATDAFCAALIHYRVAVAEGGDVARASSQIEAYGVELGAYCDANGSRLAPRAVSPGEGGASGSASGT